ncbi:MAG: imidazole glycerol phosphate synthase subunit HisH [Candidatus Omnitrophota bacterium]
MNNLNNRKVCIIDYEAGNVRSVYNMFKDIHDSVKISNKLEDIESASHIVLPGVGAFQTAIKKIKNLAAFNVLEDNVLKKKKLFLGICIGMQVLAEAGYEHGLYNGLGWIPGTVRKLETGGLRLPHVGWNNFAKCEDNVLLKGISGVTDFYYVHSYCFKVRDSVHSVAVCEYGAKFSAIINKENIYGVQFHPEKSQKAGKKLFQNFLELK